MWLLESQILCLVAEKRQGKEKKVEWKVVHLGPWFDMKTPFGC